MAKKEKIKLTKDQYLQLQGLDLQQKLDLLHDWKKSGEVSVQQFNYFSNLWISRETKRVMDIKNPLRKSKDENRPSSSMRTVIEGDIELFYNRLQGKLNYYLANRTAIGLSENELELFKTYTSKYRLYKSLINNLLVIGLRFPDKNLNKYCEEFIREHKMHKDYNDAHFWSSLWADSNLVPMDAIRLMLTKSNDGYQINPIFDKGLIGLLVPMFEVQRDKEVQRLKWAQGLESDTEREKELARKTRRLNAFNILLQAAQGYIK